VRATVIGLGKIGLPLAVQIARSGWEVHGVDIDPSVVEAVNEGRSPFPGEPDLDEGLAELSGAGLYASTDAAAAVAASDAVVVVVPLYVSDAGEPDFAPLDSATNLIASGVRAGTLVSYETTMPVGTTSDRLAPALAAGSGLTIGRDLFVCHSPERVSSGRVFQDLRRYPKLVGGVDEPSGKRGVAFYESVLQFDVRPDLGRPNGVWDLGSSSAAELAKLAETTYRDINIGFANELAMFSDRVGVDVMRVIEACNSQPYSHLHTPGVAVGGHCIPVYPHLYLHGDPTATLPRVGRIVNEQMPEYAVDLLERHSGDLRGRTVAILGLSFRGGVREHHRSGAWALVRILEARGATAVVHDPLYSDVELTDLGLVPWHLGERCDAAIVQADHAEYRRLQPADIPGASVLLDGRRCTPPDGWAEVDRLLIGGGS
jgi:nucleotide sugar dehydrogenase